MHVIKQASYLPSGIDESVWRNLPAADVERFEDVRETGLAALLAPEEVVLGEDAPVPTGLCGPQQVAGLQERQNVQSKLENDVSELLQNV